MRPGRLDTLPPARSSGPSRVRPGASKRTSTGYFTRGCARCERGVIAGKPASKGGHIVNPDAKIVKVFTYFNGSAPTGGRIG